MRVAGYTRVSTQEQKLHGVSIAAQEQALANWAVENGHEYVGCYNDAGISARSRYTKRPELLRLLRDVQAHRVDLIIFTKLDRWFRNVGDYYEIQRVLDDCGVAWKAIWEDYETETASGRLKVNIMLSVAQDEADRTSERLKQINAYRWAAGEVVQKLPAGYRREGKTVVKDEKTQEAVAAFFKAYLDTGSVVAAMDAANLLGLHTTRVGASKMLRNPFFTGTVRGISVPAYLTEAEFEQIQQRKATYVRTTTHHKIYLFSGLLVCGNCGALLGSQSNKSTLYYVCGRYVNRNGCPREVRGYANERKLEQWLVDHLESLLAQAQELQVSKVQGKSNAQNDISRQNSLTQRLERIKILFINGDIDLPEYQTRKEEIEQQLQAIRPRHRAYSEQLDNLLPEGWKDIYEGLSREGQRAFWLRTVQRIIIHQDRIPEVVFHFTF